MTLCKIRFSVRGAPREELTQFNKPRSEWKTRMCLPRVGSIEAELRSWRYDSETHSTEYEFVSEVV